MEFYQVQTQKKVYRKLPKPPSLPDIKGFNDYVDGIKCDDDLVSDLSVSVFVVCATFQSFIDLGILIESFNNDNDGSFILEFKPESKKSKKLKKKGEDSFYNSLKIRTIIKENKICAKIFKNGSLQIAGCRSIEVCHLVPKIIRSFLLSYKECIKYPDSFKLTNLKIGMINSKCKFKHKFNQQILKEIINKNTWTNNGNWRFATYQPSIYRGINAKFWIDSTVEEWTEKTRLNPSVKIDKKVKGQVAVLIFRSGSVILTGAKSEFELKAAYDSMVRLVRDNPECISYNSDSDSDSDSD